MFTLQGYKMRPFRRNRKVCSCGKDQIVAYFFGLIGISGMVYTVLYGNVTKPSDILYVDKETLNIEKGGRYAVLLKRAESKLYDNDEDSSEYLANKSDTIAPVTTKSVEAKDKGTESSLDNILKEVNSGPCVSNKTKNIYDFVISQTELEKIFTKRRNVYIVSCKKLAENDMKELVSSTIEMAKHPRKEITNAMYMSMTQNCEMFRNYRGFFQTPFTKEEEQFPIAYSIVAYKNVEQVERMLRSIYRPQNYHCIHLDKKAEQSDRETLVGIANCLPNVFLAEVSVDVRWGEMSVLEAELICMRELLKYTNWRYFINLTGQEFPLKTNMEIVQILKAMKGANLVDGTWVRARESYFYRWTKSGQPPPYNIRPIKGSVHIAVNREFVDFAINDFRSKAFLKWLNTTEIPDETFFPSLNHNPKLGIHGSFLGEPEEYPKKPTFTRYKNWEVGHGVWARKCGGKYVHNICILGLGDLHRLVDDIALFANKFYLDYQYLTYECMEEWIYEKTRTQYLTRQPIDVSFYSMLDQVRLRLVDGKRH